MWSEGLVVSLLRCVLAKGLSGAESFIKQRCDQQLWQRLDYKYRESL